MTERQKSRTYCSTSKHPVEDRKKIGPKKAEEQETSNNSDWERQEIKEASFQLPHLEN